MRLPTLRHYRNWTSHRHPHLGRSITPRHRCRLAATLHAGYPIAADSDAATAAVCRMLETITPWPTVGARVARAWPTARASSRALTGPGKRAEVAPTSFVEQARLDQV